MHKKKEFSKNLGSAHPNPRSVEIGRACRWGGGEVGIRRPQIFAEFFFYALKKNCVRVKNSTKYKTCCNSSKLIDTYNEFS